MCFVRRPINSEVDPPDHLLVAKAAYRPPLTPATDLLKQRYKHLAGLWVKSRGNGGGGGKRERETRMPDVIIPRRWLKRHFNRQTEKEGEVVTFLSVDNRISLDGIFFLNDRWHRFSPPRFPRFWERCKAIRVKDLMGEIDRCEIW